MPDQDETEHPETHGAPKTSSAETPLTRAERSLIRRLSRALRFADLMALLMVSAAAFSAFATWRTAQLMHAILMVSERPYLGVQHVAFDSVDASAARIATDCRNFGSVSANDVVSQIRLLVDGRQVSGLNSVTSTSNVGMVSPNVPHVSYRFLPLPLYRQARDDKARLVVDVLLTYRGPDERLFCYNEIFTYDRRSDSFGASGGGDRCDGQIL